MLLFLLRPLSGRSRSALEGPVSGPIDVARIFRDGCIRPREPRRKGGPSGPHSLQMGPFAIALGPRSTPGGPSWDGWSWLGTLTLQRSAFGCRKPRTYPKKIHYGDSSSASNRSSAGGGGGVTLTGALAPAAPPGYVPERTPRTAMICRLARLSGWVRCGPAV